MLYMEVRDPQLYLSTKLSSLKEGSIIKSWYKESLSPINPLKYIIVMVMFLRHTPYSPSLYSELTCCQQSEDIKEWSHTPS
jgi:hypothetical protein